MLITKTNKANLLLFKYIIRVHNAYYVHNNIKIKNIQNIIT